MEASSELRKQIQSLSINRDQRPAARGGRGAGWLVWLIVLAALGGAGYAWYSGRAAAWIEELSAPAKSAGATPSTSTAGSDGALPLLQVHARQGPPPAGPVLTASGKIVSDHTVTVATKVSGQIVALFFEQGDRVEKGQVLARIEDVIYAALRDEASARLAKAKANLEFRKFNFERVQAMYTGKDAVEIEMAEARRALDEAQGELEAGQAQLNFAQKQARDTEVTAPIAGIVLQRNVEVGDFVAAEGGRGANANATFAEIADMSLLRVEVDINELDVHRIHKDMACTVTPDAYKDLKFNGHVMWIDPGANYSKATVQAKVRIDNPDWHLRVGGAAQVSFQPEKPSEQESSRSAMWIPQAAVSSEPGAATGKVYVVNDGRAKAASVSLGARSGGQVEVTAGLSEGQTIIADKVETVRDGQRVK